MQSQIFSQEILSEIIGYLDPQHKKDIITLSSFGLMNRGCRYLSHKILFSTITLFSAFKASGSKKSSRKERACTCLCATFADTLRRSPEVARFVKHLVLRFEGRPQTSWNDWKELGDVGEQLQSLETVEVYDLDISGDYSSKMLDALGRLFSQRSIIKVTMIRPISGILNNPFKVYTQLFAKSSNLDTLEIVGDKVDPWAPHYFHPFRLEPRKHSPNVSLRTLSYDLRHTAQASVPEFHIIAQCPFDLSSLETLYVGCGAEDCLKLVAILRNCRSSLRKLSVRMIPYFPRHGSNETEAWTASLCERVGESLNTIRILDFKAILDKEYGGYPSVNEIIKNLTLILQHVREGNHLQELSISVHIFDDKDLTPDVLEAVEWSKLHTAMSQDQFSKLKKITVSCIFRDMYSGMKVFGEADASITRREQMRLEMEVGLRSLELPSGSREVCIEVKRGGRMVSNSNMALETGRMY